MGSFSASVSAWAAETQRRTEAVFKDSAQRLVKEVLTPVAEGGNMPVKTGFLRSSLRGSTETMPKVGDATATPAEGMFYAPDFGEIGLTIAGAKLGDTLYLGFTANYAPYVNAKRQFIDLAAQRWPQIVTESCQAAQARVEGSPRP